MDNINKVTILFGTQTGNAEDVAERIGRQITRMYCKARVIDANDYSIASMIEENLIICVCSTTGNGEFPDNMKSFWRFMLRKNLPNNALSHLHFCVFGLGDSSYEKFNVVAKKLNKRLLQLGATELLPLALADDQHELGYDAALDPWLISLRNSLINFYDLSGTYLSEDIVLPPKYKVNFSTDYSVISKNCVESSNRDLPFATLRANTRITASDHFQAVHLLKFGIDANVLYDPGDVAVVWPENPKEDADEFLALLNVPLDTQFTLTPSDPENSLPNLSTYPCTVRQCATSYFDIKSIPRRSFFEIFHHFSQDELEKEKLIEFTTAAGQEELYTYCNRPKRNILEVLKDFPHTTPHVPFDYLFDMIPCIRPRSFSIASSLVAHPKEFHLLIAVVEYKTRLRKPRKGLCSNWIVNLKLGAAIPFCIKKGSIALPEMETPVIMVGPGTGCAPFKAFVEQRSCNGIGGNFLFLGNRYKEKDFLFSDVWKDMCSKKILTIFTAFSRDQDEKIYVQHRIAENAKLMWELINEKEAYVYVAGNAKQMPQSVKEAFLRIIEKEGGMDSNSAVKYLQNIESKKRYQVETWA